MGIGIEVHEYENHVIEQLGLDWSDIALCELGNQKIKYRSPRIPAKKYYYALGVREHVSIDINGKNKALSLDLDYPVPSYLRNRFDVLTNYGTIEHINNQYQVFKNMHDMCKTEGVMIHSLPPVGHWPGHARYYYTEIGIQQLAELCQYDIIGDIRRIKKKRGEDNDLLCAAFRKTRGEFVSYAEFMNIEIEDTGDTSTTGNYTKLSRRWRDTFRKLYHSLHK